MTAVEWLSKEIYARGPIGEDTPIWLKELYEQAKEMEKQQIIDAYMDRMDITDKEYFKQIMGGEYYNKTYKQDI